MEKMSEIIEETIETIEKSGWTKGVSLNQQGNMCLVGGLNKVVLGKANPFLADEPDDLVSLLRSIARYLCVCSDTWIIDELYTLTQFNDARTWPEVRDFLTQAAKDLRDEGR